MNAASVSDEFRMLLKRVTSDRRLNFRKKVAMTSAHGEETNRKKQGEMKERKITFIHVKRLNSNPSLIFFSERMIIMKTNFGNSGSAFCPISKAIPMAPLC